MDLTDWLLNIYNLNKLIRGVLFLLFLLPVLAFSQQDPMYSQYMFNGLAFNPAYAGSRDALSATLLYRHQWAGIEGAPRTQTFSFHSPSKTRRHGYGLTVVNDKISFLGQTGIHLDYAYRIPFNSGKLAFGLRGSVANYRIGWQDADLKDPSDIIRTEYSGSLLMPNVGFGIYYNSDNWYIGIAAPRLLVNSFGSVAPGFDESTTDQALLRKHYFINAGFVVSVSKEIKVKPSVLFKYVAGAPFEFDANLNFYYKEKFGFGGGYRTGDGIVAMIEYYIKSNIRAGYAFDYPLTELNGYTSGSHEIMITFDFNFNTSGVVSPRVF